jgi:hypothetical protein
MGQATLGRAVARRVTIVASIGALTLAASPAAQAAVPPTSFHYVTNTMRVGSTSAEADSYGFNLDDMNPVVDNALGRLLAALSGQLDVNAAMATALETGDVVVLHSLRAHQFGRDEDASWRVYLGTPTPDPVLTGRGSFTIDPSAPTSTDLAGEVMRRQFTGGPGAVALRLGLVAGETPIELHLIGARVQADCSPVGCSNGKIGGGISAAEVDGVIVPALARAMQVVIDATCPASPSTSCTDPGATLVAFFDTNGDHIVTADELRAIFLIQALLSPDVDLLDAAGHPGHDGVRESLSLGLGFTAKNAIFSE